MSGNVILEAGARLFTNLSSVSIGEVRTHCHAMLLEPPNEALKSLHPPHPQLRGFGTEAAWPVFTLPLSTLDYEMTPNMGDGTFLSAAVGEVPIGGGADLVFASGAPTLRLRVEEPEKPLRIDNVEGMDITDVWELLERRTPEYCFAPHMPYLAYCPPSMVASERSAGRLRQMAIARGE
jgi:hypothetical protein